MEAGGPIRFVASTEGVKRDGKDLSADDWLLDDYRANPVVLWAHDYVGRTLPIGKGVGVFPIDVEGQGVDFLSADAHKWMLGPEGVGLGYASPRALERISPALEGWLSVSRPFDFFDLEQPLKPTAARFEEGAYNTAGLHGMAGSLSLIEEYGAKAMGERVIELTDRLADELGPLDILFKNSDLIQFSLIILYQLYRRRT